MQTDGTLLVPDVPTVPYITGDGVGAEVTPAMQAVVDAAIRKAYGGKRRIEWKEVLAGERAFNETGSWLPEETMEALNELVKCGKVRAIGVSAMYGYQFHNMQIIARDNHWTPFSTMENHYNLLYREDEKLFFLHSYYQSGMSKHAFCRAHGICCPALLNSWIKKYSNLAEELSLPSEQESPDMSNRSKEAYKDENAQLKKRIKELEKALSFSKLETEARELMITRAEELFNIPIRKKSGAKS